MKMQRRRVLLIAALALAGMAVGIVAGNVIGRLTVDRLATEALAGFAAEMVRHADDYEQEILEIKAKMEASKFPHCSAEDISLMQLLTFRSEHVKEVGRVDNGYFVCSALVPKLENPWRMPSDPLVLPMGARVYPNIPLKFAGPGEGVVVQLGEIDFVLSPNSYDHWRRPDARYMIVLINPTSGRMVRIAGDDLQVAPAAILGEREEKSALRIIESRCSHVNRVCAVTEETTRQTTLSGRPLIRGYTLMGGVAGLCLGFAVAQFYLRRVGRAQQLRRALRRRSPSLRLVYQPILHLPSRTLAGAEALLRWTDEDGNSISPDSFIRTAEEFGFIREVTAFVVDRALDELGELLREYPEFTLSLNIAAADLEGVQLLYALDRKVREQKVLPRQIALELTERSTTHLDVLRESLASLHQAGYKVHIDDFGTGFSNLAYLAELQVDTIKVDRTFTSAIGTDAVTASILPQILVLAETLHVNMIVEGVETDEQLDFLLATRRNLMVQGWYFSKPVRADELPLFCELTSAATHT